MISVFLKKISIINYKNILDKEYELDPKINCFVGDNGVGKTNILEGISLISKGRGLRNSAISNLIKFNKKNFQIKCCLNVNENIYDIDEYFNYEFFQTKKIIYIPFQK